MKIEKLYGAFGAVISEIDLKESFSNSNLNILKQAKSTINF
jgi:hypothetical protein